MDFFFEIKKQVFEMFKSEKSIPPIVFARNDKENFQFLISYKSDEGRDNLLDALAKLFKDLGVKDYCLACEGWMSEDLRNRPSKSKDKVEALFLIWVGYENKKRVVKHSELFFLERDGEEVNLKENKDVPLKNMVGPFMEILAEDFKAPSEFQRQRGAFNLERFGKRLSLH